MAASSPLGWLTQQGQALGGPGQRTRVFHSVNHRHPCHRDVQFVQALLERSTNH